MDSTPDPPVRGNGAEREAELALIRLELDQLIEENKVRKERIARSLCEPGATEKVPVEVVQLLSEEPIKYAVVANLSACDMARFGDIAGFCNRYLVVHLFGTLEVAQHLDESLKGALMPSGWVQRPLVCTLIKPSPEILIGVFTIEEQDLLEMDHWRIALNEKIIAAWKGKAP